MTTPPRFDRADFRKSSYSDPNQNCVEVARCGDLVALRDSKTAFGSAADHRVHLNVAAFATLLATVG